LNNYGNDFKGGLFHFQDGDLATIVPSGGVSEDFKRMFSSFFTHLHALELTKIEFP
jgi:hypothetical protein